MRPRDPPEESATPPTYRKSNPADFPILVLSVSSETRPLATVDDYADNVLAQQLSRILGVGQVQIQGERKPAVRVQVDPLKLAAMGLSLEDIRARSSTPPSTRQRGASRPIAAASQSTPMIS